MPAEPLLYYVLLIGFLIPNITIFHSYRHRIIIISINSFGEILLDEEIFFFVFIKREDDDDEDEGIIMITLFR